MYNREWTRDGDKGDLTTGKMEENVMVKAVIDERTRIGE